MSDQVVDYAVTVAMSTRDWGLLCLVCVMMGCSADGEGGKGRQTMHQMAYQYVWPSYDDPEWDVIEDYFGRRDGTRVPSQIPVQFRHELYWMVDDPYLGDRALRLIVVMGDKTDLRWLTQRVLTVNEGERGISRYYNSAKFLAYMSRRPLPAAQAAVDALLKCADPLYQLERGISVDGAIAYARHCAIAAHFTRQASVIEPLKALGSRSYLPLWGRRDNRRYRLAALKSAYCLELERQQAGVLEVKPISLNDSGTWYCAHGHVSLGYQAEAIALDEMGLTPKDFEKGESLWHGRLH
ncbi:MAG: hypothetical protein ACE366_04215 [Bradymonadia bacterium]